MNHDGDEDDHTTQVQITGDQGFSKTIHAFLPKRLTRSQSVNISVSRDANVLIGVSIEKATVESKKGDELCQASVHVSRGLRKQRSMLSMSASSPARKNWVARAKEFIFRRTKNHFGPPPPIPP